MADDPKTIVARGYDVIAERYAAWGDPTQGSKGRYAARALTVASPGDPVLDLGCGTGEQVTRQLATRFATTGVDISPRSIEIARSVLPDVTFHVADMATIDFSPDSFALVTAFFSLIHVPREEHGATLARIATWLRRGGHLVATMSAGRGGTDVDEDWLGTRMYWSGWDRDTNVRLVAEAGLEVVDATDEVDLEDGVPVTSLWIVARRPAG